jgi:hypothetical protein
MSTKSLPVLLALLAACWAPAAQADSFASSASSLASKSVGSLSDSLTTSSQSSTGGDAKPVAGAYRVLELAQAGDKPGWQRLTLAPEADPAQTWTLLLPARVVTEQLLVAGATMALLERTYGLALAKAQDAEPFYLLLDGAAQRRLASVKV